MIGHDGNGMGRAVRDVFAVGRRARNRAVWTVALPAVLMLSIAVPVSNAIAADGEGAVPREAVEQLGALIVPAFGFGSSPPAIGGGQQYADRSDEQALQVAAREDPALFTAQPTRTLDPPAGSTVERYLDDYSARIDVAGQGPDAIAYSTTPLRVEQDGVKRAVDLRLVDRGAAIEPKTPLVQLSFPGVLGQGITIAENIRMRVVGADPAAEARIAGQQVFYANALTDADVFAMALPAGLETFVQLRSAESPTTIAYDFDLPDGAHLVQQSGAGAPVAIMRGAEVLAVIARPVSKDANDQLVATTMRISGTRLILDVEVGESTAFPVLVDPIVTDNQFYNGDAASTYGFFHNTLGWQRETSGALANFTFSPNGDNPSGGGTCTRYVGTTPEQLSRQLCVVTQSARSYGGELGQWAWRPPGGLRSHLNDGANIDTDAYVYRAYVRHSYTRLSTSNNAFMYAGIRSGRTGGWIGKNVNVDQYGNHSDERYGYWSFGENTTGVISNASFLRMYCATNDCATESNDPNIDGAGFAFGVYALGSGHALSANAQGAVFYQYDRTAPTVTQATGTDLSGWKNSGTVGTVVSGSDNGMGMQRVGLSTGATQTHGCSGGILSYCPHSLAQTFYTNVADLPEGIQQISAYGDDILDKRSYAASPLTIKVDRSPPVVGMTGPAVDASFLANGSYAFRADARDGDAANPRSGAARLTVSLADSNGNETQLFDSGTASCPAGSCAITRDLQLDTSSLIEGRYTLVARATDQLGQASTAREEIVVDRAAPTMELAGDLRDGRDGRTLSVQDDADLLIRATDSAGVASSRIRIDGNKPAADADKSQSCTAGGCPLSHDYLQPLVALSPGSHTVSVTVVDKGGREASDSWQIEVDDREAPPADEDPAAPSNGPSSVSDSNTTRYKRCESRGAAIPFPVVSLGSTFESLTAVAALRRCDDPYVNEAVRANYVSYIYGDCQIDPAVDDERCAPPLEIQSWPACERSLVDYTFDTVGGLLTGLQPGALIQRRGAPTSLFDNGLRLEIYTGKSTIVIFGSNAAQVIRAVTQIRTESLIPPKLPSAFSISLGGLPILGNLAAAAIGALTGTLSCAS
jgi:hypothetical protein